MYQRIIVVGNLGGDPEMRYMPDGTAVTSFSVATNRRWTDGRSGETKDETCWFRVSVWGKQAETTNQFLTKGQKVLVEGRLKPDPQTGGPRLWTGQDGTVRASFEISADAVRFLSPKGGEASYEPSESQGGHMIQEEDDIPF
ncbi:MAG: single-stranded DNA-binding protein [Chloroflexi bacterium]|nr:single-stranded DNA-binding protein [Chloroflexota bacterium]MCI0575553.1 single-stranded DNA-binding protein [Chloroflexota bacterium]MCI0649959.1 single-stranded DNA-binding protein [Chloroflexota bacterium]MCI0729289.1 single-stranded DNA-binding protein [Chloroflexota bacterium]